MRAQLSLKASRCRPETARRGYLIRLQRETEFAHPFAECDTVDNSLTLCQSFPDFLPSTCTPSPYGAPSQRYGYQGAETERGPSFPRPSSVGEDFPTWRRSRPFMPGNLASRCDHSRFSACCWIPMRSSRGWNQTAQQVTTSAAILPCGEGHVAAICTSSPFVCGLPCMPPRPMLCRMGTSFTAAHLTH